MNVLYLDCFSGISGDMTIGALLDLGIIDTDKFVAELKKLSIADEFEIKISKTQKNAITATDFTVYDLHRTHGHTEHGHHHDEHHHDGHDHEHHHDHHGRNFADIKQIINQSNLDEKVKALSLKMFDCIAVAEAKVHGKTKDEVHFHEVGAVDSIVDIVGCAICVTMLNVDKVVCSVINEGHGFVECQHGLIPVPVPATAQILSSIDADVRFVDIDSELVTPTGASVVATLTNEFGNMPNIKNCKIGYGAGKKTFETPNLLRVMYGQDDKEGNGVVLLESNIDDMTGENAGYVMDKLFGMGALDVFYTPIYMKKNRPAIKLSVLCQKDDRTKFEYAILKETTTIGIRCIDVSRTVMEREEFIKHTCYGDVRMKKCMFEDIEKISPEYEDVVKIAKETGLTFNTVCSNLMNN